MFEPFVFMEKSPQEALLGPATATRYSERSSWLVSFVHTKRPPPPPGGRERLIIQL